MNKPSATPMFYSPTVNMAIIVSSLPLAVASDNMLVGWFVLCSSTHTVHHFDWGLVGPSYMFVAFYFSFITVLWTLGRGFLFNFKPELMKWPITIGLAYMILFTRQSMSLESARDQNYRLIKLKLFCCKNIVLSVRCSHWIYCGEGVTLAVHMSHSGSERRQYIIWRVSV